MLYKEIQSNYVSNKKITCSVDREAQKNARKLRLAFEDLGVTFIKLGQIMSKRPDLIPFSYVQELSQLQNKVGSISFEEMGASFEGYNIGCQTKDVTDPYSESIAAFVSRFDEFNKKPIASASIAQVYEAVLNGKRVAVKIARPNLIDLINVDLSIINDLKPLLARIGGFGSNFDIDSFLDEFK